MNKEKIDVLLGLQFGDEGKGKIVDTLAHEYDVIARFQGGPNSGHTIIGPSGKLVLHQIPSGVFNDKTKLLIGDGMVIDPVVLWSEIEAVTNQTVNFLDRFYVSGGATLITPMHKYLDAAYEKARGSGKIGTTGKGIGPAYMDRVGRFALSVTDSLKGNFRTRYYAVKTLHKAYCRGIGFKIPKAEFEKAEEEWFLALRSIQQAIAKNHFLAGEYWLRGMLALNKRVLAEGAQGTMLDVFHGTYPFVTSSHTTAGGACIGLGLPPNAIGKVIGVAKAYTTRVGEGPFPTDLDGEMGVRLRKTGEEFGSTTGRPRRCGWLDLSQLKYAVMINGVTKLIITKLDVLSGLPEIPVCSSYNGTVPKPVYEKLKGWQGPISHAGIYNHLYESAQQYVRFVEHFLKVEVTHVSVGPNREQTLRVE